MNTKVRTSTGWTSWRIELLLLGLALIAVVLAYQLKGPSCIHLGNRSANPFVEGFSFREGADTGTYRWSGARAALTFRGIGRQDGVLYLRFGAPQGQVRLWANGHLMTPEPIGSPEPADHVLPIPRDWIGAAGNLAISLESATFSVPPDTRALGAQVVSACFRPGAGPVLPALPTVLYVVLGSVLGLFAVRTYSGSARAAWAAAAVILVASAWGLGWARLEAAWLIAVVFWFAVAACVGACLAVWALRRLGVKDHRELRLVGLLCLGALAVRLPFAVTPGYLADMQDHLLWSYKVTHYGLGATYVTTDGLWNPNYPPVSIYAFQALGKVYQRLFAPDFLYPGVASDPALRAETTNLALLGDPIHRTLLRMPAILADLATGALVFALVRRKASAGRSFVIAATVWFNPVAIYNSSAWGQIDALTTVFAVLAVALAEMEHAGWAFFALAVSGLTKPQGFVFGPLLLLRTIQRQGWQGLWRATLGGVAGVILVMAPMVIAGAFPSMIARFGDWIGDYPQLSMNGHNLWWLIKVGNVSAEDTLPALGSLRYRAVSLLLFALAYALVLAGTLRRPDRSLWPAAAYVALAFFFLPTEVHENYGFAALPMLAVAMGTEIRLAVPYAVLTLTMVANYALHDPSLLAWLALPAPDTQLLGLRWANAALNGVLFAVWTAWEVYRLVKAPGPIPASAATPEKG